MLSETVFARATKEHIIMEPFPHLVLENALPHDVFHKLLSTRPHYPSSMNTSNKLLPIYANLILSLDFYNKEWKNFIAKHTTPDIYYKMRELFADCWPESQPVLPKKTTRFGLFHRDSWQNGGLDVLTDARVDISSPVYGKASSHRKAHLDEPNRLFSALFYMRDDDDDSQGGGLDLFSFTGEPCRPLDVFELPDTKVKRVKTYPYKANTLVAFPQSINAIHGAQIREVTSHERTFVFITAEVEHDFLK
ncbi:MAG: 2OG-Fe(II) oxygenase [Magnetococcales bacterium]|nr:2OG-Fe(II) oxygenase [Magnetococcales bacterium]